ncbi:MAG: DsrH/TusB family sulfur metabolism protein [Candidatus Bathyarchaeia archaeon]
MRRTMLAIISSPQTDHTSSAITLAKEMMSANSTVSIFLLQDAVIHAVRKHPASAQIERLVNLGVEIFVLGEDLAERGYGQADIISGVGIAGYDYLVESMMEEHDSIVGAF